VQVHVRTPLSLTAKLRFAHSVEAQNVFAILCGANCRRHEVDFQDDPVIVDVSMSPTSVEITMTAAHPVVGFALCFVPGGQIGFVAASALVGFAGTTIGGIQFAVSELINMPAHLSGINVRHRNSAGFADR
jgi:hypothetical protein